MANPVPKRAWRLSYKGRLAEVRGRLADTDAERATADAALAAYLLDVDRYELAGGVVPQMDVPLRASTAVMHGDLLARGGHADQARAVWQAAAAQVRPSAERLNPAAMTQLAQLDLRLGGVQDARAWADRVLGTSYRHPAFADLQQRLGQAQQAGAGAKP